MRPNLQTTRDPLNVAALPPTEGMELDYRTRGRGANHEQRTTMHTVLTASSLGLLVAAILRCCGAYTSSTRFLAGAMLLGLLLAVLQYYGKSLLSLISFGLFAIPIVFMSHNAGEFLFLILAITTLAASFLPYFSQPSTNNALRVLYAGPLIWLLSVATHTALLILLILATLMFILHLSEQMSTHYAHWMRAHPFLNQSKRQRWLAVWKPTTWFGYLLSLWRREPDAPFTDRITRLETRERERFALGFGAVLLAYLVAVLVYLFVGDPLLGGMTAILIFVLLLIAYGVANVLTYSRRATVGGALVVSWRAIASWCTYNDHGTIAPGVFQSPCGSVRKRQGTLSLGLFTVALATLPVAWYFPVGMLLFGYEPLLRTVGPMPWEDGALGHLLLHGMYDTSGGPPNEKPADGASSLTPSQRKYIEQLPSARREPVQKALSELGEKQQAMTTAYQTLVTRPEAILVTYLRGILLYDTWNMFSSVLAFVCCLLAPPLLLGSMCFAIAGRRLVHHAMTLEGSRGRRALYHARPRTSLMDAYQSRLRASRFETGDQLGRPIAERDHLLLGFSWVNDYPILLSPSILHEHAHITGDTGSGKSALGIAPLMAQLIDRGDSSIVVLDLKGDMALFEAARIGVEEVNKRRGPEEPRLGFQWFTNHPDRSTHLFNPFLQSDMQTVSRHQRVEILLKSLGLDYGEGYGTSYFSSVHRHVLNRLFEQDVEFDSFRKLDFYLRSGSFSTTASDIRIDKRAQQEASHLYTVVESLASFDALNVTSADRLPGNVLESQIDMGKVVRQPTVVYFGLPSALEETSVREIAKLALHCLLVAAVRRGASSHQTYVFIDEFQQVVSEHLEIVLRQARSAGIAAILANQTLSDLKKGNVNIIPTVQANTRFKQIFSATDVLQQDMTIQASGEALYELESWRVNQDGMVDCDERGNIWHNENDQVGPRLRRNDIIEASDDELRSIVHITRGHGFTQFGGFMFPMRSAFHISNEEYGRRRRADWPRQADHPGTITPPLPLPTQPERPGGRSASGPKRPPQPMPSDELVSDLVRRLEQFKEKP